MTYRIVATYPNEESWVLYGGMTHEDAVSKLRDLKDSPQYDNVKLEMIENSNADR